MNSHGESKEGHAKIGDENAAQDLYGNGVRVGFYLQALAMILYHYGNKKNRGKGLKIASGSLTTSILASWFVYAMRAQFSPSESLVVLLFLLNLSFPAKMTLLNPQTVPGETIGLIILMVNELGICTALIWLFSSLVSSLPLRGTPNVIYYAISLSGWFRWVALAVCIADVLTSLIFICKAALVVTIAWECYMTDSTEVNQQNFDRITLAMDWDVGRATLRAMMLLAFVFVVVTVETTIHWNCLSPSADLQAPGQLIPLLTGAILLIDGSFVALQVYIKPLVECLLGMIEKLDPTAAILRLRQRIATQFGLCYRVLRRLLR